MSMDTNENKNTYRVVGFTCANCANTFERNVEDLPGVSEAKVNFAASKVTVYGKASIAELEKAGAFEGLRIFKEDDELLIVNRKIWKSSEFWRTVAALVLMMIGWFVGKQADNAAISAAIYGASILIGGYALLWQGMKNFIRFRFDMKTLMSVAVIGAALIGEWGEGAVVVFLFSISEALESYSMERARKSIRTLMDAAPKEADVFRDGKLIRVSVRDIHPGDRFDVKPGQKIALDGVVEEGHSAVNEASITGESIPAEKSPGDPVYAGTLNEQGLLRIKATRKASDTMLAKIIHLVEEAQTERAPAQAFVDRFAKVYTPIIMLIATGMAILPPLLFQADWLGWLYRGLTVLVVGCPCALVISTPVAVVTAIGSAANRGVLIKGGVHLEEVGKLRAIAFDKTGTLTRGIPKVTHVTAYNGNHKDEIIRRAAAVEQGSNHPLAKAIINEAKSNTRSLPKAWQFVTITGKGAQAIVEGRKYVIGSPKLFESNITDEVKKDISKAQRDGQTVMLLGTDEAIEGMIAVSDEIRESSRQTIKQLQDLGIRHTVMLTGDHAGTAKVISEKSGVTEYHAELLPEDKLNFVKRLKKTYGKTGMIGDGMNDAPALAAADTGIAMGGAGTDSALEAADIVLMSDHLEQLPYTIKLSRKSLAIIRENIIFSIGIKVLALLLIIPGWLTLWMAIFADMGATLIVTLNALRLLRLRK